MTYNTLQFQSPLGWIQLTGSQSGLRRITFQDTNLHPAGTSVPWCLKLAKEQIVEYLHGQRTEFEIPLDMQGTFFQITVWQTLRGIPFGSTVSYADIARKVGNPRACRAVGGANNKNPLPIVIPCHRVIGHDGRLVGYGSGLWRKKLLLALEGVGLEGGKVNQRT